MLPLLMRVEPPPPAITNTCKSSVSIIDKVPEVHHLACASVYHPGACTCISSTPSALTISPTVPPACLPHLRWEPPRQVPCEVTLTVPNTLQRSQCGNEIGLGWLCMRITVQHCIWLRLLRPFALARQGDRSLVATMARDGSERPDISLFIVDIHRAC